jgi:hypothetical protein
MNQQRAGPPAPLFPAVKYNECGIGIAHDFHRNGLIGGTLIWRRSLRKLISTPSLEKRDEEAFRIIK